MLRREYKPSEHAGAVEYRGVIVGTKKQSVKNYQILKKIKDMRKILIIGMVAIAATACNVTRTVTTRSEAWQKGDTSVVIQSKTIETYDASKKL